MSANIGENTIVTNGLVLYLDAANYKSYTSGSTVWRDIISSNVSGSLVNGATFSSGNAGSIQFDGVDDYSILPNNNSIYNFSSDFCFDVWINPAVVTGSPHIVYAAVPDFTIQFDNLSSDQLIVYSGSKRIIGSVSTNQWTNIMITRTGTSITAYKNAVTANTWTSSAIYYFSNSLFGGRTSPALYLNGKIASLKLYNKFLSAAEVLQNYNALKGRFGLP